MRANEPFNARHLRVSGILLIVGLLVEGVSLLWNHPIAFDLFLYVGGVFFLSGIAVFLYSLVTHFLRRRGA
jgi:hypothetical protein